MDGPVVLRGVGLADGTVADVVVEGDVVARVEPAAARSRGPDPTAAPPAAAGSRMPAPAGPPAATVLDLAGWLVLPAPAEPHAHLDKALTADRVPNRTGDLPGAIEAWHAYRPRLTVDDIAERAERAARRLLAGGCTAIRTHVDVGADIGVRSVEALERVRARLAGLVDLQVVALASVPTTGAAGAGNRAALRDAMDAGADVVGGCPHLDADPAGCIDLCLQLAADRGRPLDLHMDETLNPAVLALPDLCDRVEQWGFALGATASHCVSLGMQDEATQARVAARCAATGVAVVTLPQTNLFLQGRNRPVATPRGLTALAALRAAGALVAAGADNLQDPFNTVGRGDPMETAALLVMAGHLLPEEAYRSVSTAARRALGLPAAAGLVVAPGDPAELVALPAASVRAAIADAPPARVVIHAGRVVSGLSGAGQGAETEASQFGHAGPSAVPLGSQGS